MYSDKKRQSHCYIHFTHVETVCEPDTSGQLQLMSHAMSPSAERQKPDRL